MRLYRHSSYDEYRDAQIEKNLKKLERVFVTPHEVAVIAERIPRPVTLGLCHGVRNGWEVHAFRRALGSDAIIGTEISPTAAEMEGCIVWDFHDVKPEWLGRTDFIYSNALDHSYDPAMCLGRWISCLSSRGVCVIDWHKTLLSRVDRADCFKATTREVGRLCEGVGRVVDVARVDGRTLFFLARNDATAT